MKTKAFEIRDAMTFIPVIATQMAPTTEWPAGAREEERAYERIEEAERYLLGRSGYSPATQPACVILCRMAASGMDCNATYDPFAWDTNTMRIAHQHILQHFDTLESGAVIDVEFITGQSAKVKESERVTRR